MTQPSQEEFDALMRSNLGAFSRKVYATLKPNDPLEDNWHIDAIVHQLNLVRSGETRRLILNIAPRSLKSMIVSVAYPAFLLGHDPSVSIMVVSHNQLLAVQLSNLFRKIVEARWYKRAFPGMRGLPDKNSETSFVTAAGGGRQAQSTDSGVTGTGADHMIIDDPSDASKANDQTACLKVNEWIDSTLSSRRNSPTKSSRILVMQRLSIYDTTAHFLEKGGWVQLKLPAISEATVTIPTGPNTAHVFKQGDLLHPERMPQSYLDEQRADMGEANFLAQYLQKPVPSGAGVIDTALFKRYNAPPKYFEYTFLSVDPASGTDSGSYSAIQKYGVVNGRLYLLWVTRGKWKFPALCDLIILNRTRQKIEHIVVERAGYGVAVLEELSGRLSMEDRCFNLHGMVPKTSKIHRMEQAMVAVTKGLVEIPQEAIGMPEFLNELEAFPTGKHDDQVDAFSQAVRFFRRLEDNVLKCDLTLIPRG